MLKIGNPWKLMVWLLIYDLVAEENQYHAASLPRSVAIPYAKNIQVSMQRQQFQVTKPFSFHVTFYNFLWSVMIFYEFLCIFYYVFLRFLVCFAGQFLLREPRQHRRTPRKMHEPVCSGLGQLDNSFDTPRTRAATYPSLPSPSSTSRVEVRRRLLLGSPLSA